MIDGVAALGAADDYYNVKLRLVRQIAFTDEGVGRPHYPCYLLGVYGIERILEIGCARLDLHEHYAVAVCGHDVEFLMADVDIPVIHGISLPAKEFAGCLFAPRAEIVVLSHVDVE